MSISVARTSKTENNNATDCAKSMNCWSCVKESLCSWSLDKQACVNTKQIPGNMVVHIEKHCPHFTVTQKSAIGNESYENRIKVTGQVQKFSQILSEKWYLRIK